MSGWREAHLPPFRPTPSGWLLVGLRGLAFGAVTYGGLGLLLLMRAIEAPLCGMSRPVTPYVTQGVCKAAYWIMGIGLVRRGRPMAMRGAVVANHSSWLDIFALNACDRVYFVSKSEVARWPGIGWLARATGTVFIARNAAEAKVQQGIFEARLREGHRLLFFPEGTSTDTQRILQFKSTLFAAFFAHDMNHLMHIQPVTVSFIAPPDADPRLYGWWGDMAFGPHLLRILSQRRQGSVEVHYHPAVAVRDFADRKALAAYCEARIREAHRVASAGSAERCE